MDKPKKKKPSIMLNPSALLNRDCQRRQENDHFPHVSPSGVTISHLRLIIWLCQLLPLDWHWMAAKCELFLFLFFEIWKSEKKNHLHLNTVLAKVLNIPSRCNIVCISVMHSRLRCSAMQIFHPFFPCVRESSYCAAWCVWGAARGPLSSSRRC